MAKSRTGAARRSDVSPKLRAELEAGTAAATLSEMLVIDFAKLLAAAVPDISRESLAVMREAATLGVTRRMQIAAECIARELPIARQKLLGRHPSDTVRGWWAYLVALRPKRTLAQRLADIRPLAADEHFGVREWAWLALRGSVAAEVDHAIELLAPWTRDHDVGVRRFAIEITRPRGVWSAHLPELKSEPERAEPLLAAVMADPQRYVQNSAANWLNDAGKTQPEWVRAFCRQWQRGEPSPATKYIVRRGMRGL